MKFLENNENVITLPKYQESFIYFLINDGEVVYVGQTRNGLSRPLSHRDKAFNEIKILYCSPEELDFWEDKYIQKYNPLYNKKSNYTMRWTLLRVRNYIREQLGLTDYTVPKLKALLDELKIVPKIDCYIGKPTISVNERNVVIDHLRRGNNGRV